MKLKTFVDLVSVSTNLYMLSKDKELMDQLKAYGEQGKEKASEVWHELSEKDMAWDEFMAKINERATTAKVELENKIEEIAVKIYSKMNIAHTNDIELLKSEIEKLKNQVAVSEQHIDQLQKQLQIKG